MADSKTSVNVLPCLFWRFCESYEQGVSKRSYHHDISGSQYRYIVLKDVEDLLNTKAGKVDFCDEIKKTVINYGINCCIGIISSKNKTDNIALNIRDAIVNFEPRFISDSVKVDVVEFDKPESIRNVVLEISAQLKMLKSVEYLKFKTKMDVDTGHYKIERGGIE